MPSDSVSDEEIVSDYTKVTEEVGHFPSSDEIQEYGSTNSKITKVNPVH